MTGLLFLFGLFLALGLFFLAASLLKLPTIGESHAGNGEAGEKSSQNSGNLPDDRSGAAGEVYPHG